MRDHRYRAFHKEHGRMYEVMSIQFGSGTDSAGNIKKVYLMGSNKGTSGSKIELLEYTGLKDKNGVEIVEGDILKWHDEYAQVIYSEGDTSFLADGLEYIDLGGFDTQPILNGLKSSMTVHYVVIGNVWENKELLK